MFLFVEEKEAAYIYLMTKSFDISHLTVLTVVDLYNDSKFEEMVLNSGKGFSLMIVLFILFNLILFFEKSLN